MCGSKQIKKPPKNLTIPVNLCTWCWALKIKWLELWLICATTLQWLSCDGWSWRLAFCCRQQERWKESLQVQCGHEHRPKRILADCHSFQPLLWEMASFGCLAEACLISLLTSSSFSVLQGFLFCLFVFNFSLYPGPWMPSEQGFSLAHTS